MAYKHPCFIFKNAKIFHLIIKLSLPISVLIDLNCLHFSISSNSGKFFCELAGLRPVYVHKNRLVRSFSRSGNKFPSLLHSLTSLFLCAGKAFPGPEASLLPFPGCSATAWRRSLQAKRSLAGTVLFKSGLRPVDASHRTVLSSLRSSTELRSGSAHGSFFAIRLDITSHLCPGTSSLTAPSLLHRLHSSYSSSLRSSK